MRSTWTMVAQLVALLAGLAGAGCIGSTYVPQVRDDYATVFLRRGAYLHVRQPRVRAISLTPPFACSAQTVRLAERGVGAAVEREAEEVERFGDLDAALGRGIYAVRTVSGPDLDVGPWLYVVSGAQSEDPALTALNVANRYNAVAACVAKTRRRR